MINIINHYLNYITQPLRSETQIEKWTQEDKFLLYCYVWTNPTQRGYRKRMIEIWEEYARFKTTSQGLADQARTIIKKGWFSDLEILEIHQ